MQDPPCRLLLIRHGNTAGNEARLDAPMSGWADVPLSPRGRLEALALRPRLSRARIAAVCSSPLSRARDTAMLAMPDRSLLLLDDLREIHCGDADGLSIAEAKARYPDHWDANLRQDDDDFRWPGGESYRELRARCLGAVERIAEAHPGEPVAVFTHAGVVTQVLGAMFGESAARWERFRPANCSITTVDWCGDRGVLVRFDEQDHLTHLDATRESPGS